MSVTIKDFSLKNTTVKIQNPEHIPLLYNKSKLYVVCSSIVNMRLIDKLVYDIGNNDELQGFLSKLNELRHKIAQKLNIKVSDSNSIHKISVDAETKYYDHNNQPGIVDYSKLDNCEFNARVLLEIQSLKGPELELQIRVCQLKFLNYTRLPPYCIIPDEGFDNMLEEPCEEDAEFLL